MAGAVDIARAAEDGLLAFHPAFRIENVAARVRELAEAVIRCPASTRGVDHEDLPVLLQHLRTFVEAARAADRFPREHLARDVDDLASQLGRAAHLADEESLCRVRCGSVRPPRPDAIELPVLRLEDRSIDRPRTSVERGHIAVRAERIFGVGLQDDGAVVDVVAVIRAGVDVPVAVDVMQLGSPEPAGAGTACVSLVGGAARAAIGQRFGFVDVDRLRAWRFGNRIIKPVRPLDDPGDPGWRRSG